MSAIFVLIFSAGTSLLCAYGAEWKVIAGCATVTISWGLVAIRDAIRDGSTA